MDGRVRTLNEALEAGHETARLSPTRRSSLRQLEFYGSAGIRIELAVINTRVLARGVYNAVRRGDTIAPHFPKPCSTSRGPYGLWPSFWSTTKGPRRPAGGRSKRPGGRPRSWRSVTSSGSASSSARSAPPPSTSSGAPGWTRPPPCRPWKTPLAAPPRSG